MEIEPIPIRIKLSKVDWAVVILFQMPFVVVLVVRDCVMRMIKGGVKCQ